MSTSTPSRKSSRSSRAAASSTAAASKEAATTPTKSKRRSVSPTKRPVEEPDRKAPRTPPRRTASSSSSKPSSSTEDVGAAANSAHLVTPATAASALAQEKKKSAKAKTAATAAKKSNARRSLNLPSPTKTTAEKEQEPNDEKKQAAASKKEVKDIAGGDTATTPKKLPFGGSKKPIEIPSNVSRVYQIVHKHTGSIGGNGHGGAIYGELTTGSMQKMTNLMMQHCNLSSESRFIDVGCGLGKPNLHVAQYPGVEFSYGIEMEQVRWMLGMANLHQVLDAAKKDVETEKETDVGHACFFAHGDITEANYFDPFTHVYMFDIGFPPRLFHILAEMFNRSQSEYLICYHGPKLMIENYGFNIELIVQTPTSMHGSAEGHTGYIYRRSTNVKKPSSSKLCKKKQFGVPCDPLFAKAWETCREGLDAVHKYTSDKVEKHMGISSKRVTRSAARRKSGLAEEKKSD